MARSVLITGASSGIGLYTARELLAHGWDVIATVRSEEKAAALRSELPNIRTIIADLTTTGAIEKIASEVEAMTNGQLFALVNNAGFAVPGAIEDVTPELAREQYEVNVFAPMFLARALVPLLRRAGGGRIIQVSSVSGLMSAPMLGWYASSKHALESLSDSLRMEVAPFNIKVVLIEPGSFGTNIWGKAGGILPESMTTGPYAHVYKRADRIINQKHPEPTPVARAIREALESDKPKARYLIGAGLRQISVLGILPTRVSDFLLSTALGLTQPKPWLRKLLRRLGI